MALASLVFTAPGRGAFTNTISFFMRASTSFGAGMTIVPVPSASSFSRRSLRPWADLCCPPVFPAMTSRSSWPDSLVRVVAVGAAPQSEIGADNHRDSNIKHLGHQIGQDGQRPHEWLIAGLAKFPFHAGGDENGDIDQNAKTAARRGEARNRFAQNGESQGDGGNHPQH